MTRTIADYRAAYAKADALCIEAQSFRNKAGIPAAMELRYAGHHFLLALDDNGQIVSQEHLTSAISHTRRACYEATEAGIMFAVALIKKFTTDYSTIEVAGIIPDYVARIRRANEGMRLIEAGREDGYDRAGDHQVRIDVFHELRSFCDDLEAGREEANKKVAAARKADRRFLLQIVLSILSIAIVVGGILWASSGYRGGLGKNDAPAAQSR